MANNAISALSVGAPAVTIRNPMATRLKRGSASSAPIINAAADEASRAPLASPDKPSPVGSKKEMSLPELRETLIAPDPATPAATTLELDELWSLVFKHANKRWVWIA
jgi:hypothetical protein